MERTRKANGARTAANSDRRSARAAVDVADALEVPEDDPSKPSLAARVHSEEGRVPWSPIGIGKPLMLTLCSVYSGREDGRGNVRGDAGALLVMSTAKDPVDQAASVVAMNAWHERVTPGQVVSLENGGAGSRVLYYSPAESVRELSISVQLKFDLFDAAQWDAWREAAQASAALPVFLGGMVTGGPVGVAAGQALVNVIGGAAGLAIKALDTSIDGNGAIVLGWNMPIESPGRPRQEPGWMLLTPDSLAIAEMAEDDGEDDSFLDFVLGDDGPRSVPRAYEVDGKQFAVRAADQTLRHKDDGSWPDGTPFAKGEVVRGPFPYALVKVDGTPNKKLRRWKPTKVSAELASQFLRKGGATELPQLAASVFDSYANLQFVNQASDLAADIALAGSKEEKALLVKQREAVIDSITDDKLRELLRDKGAGKPSGVAKRSKDPAAVPAGAEEA